MSKSEHIAFVCPRFSETATIGGAETLIKSLAMRAVRNGRKVTFLTTCATDHFTWKNELPAGSSNYQGIEVTYFPVNEDRDIETFIRVQNKISTGAAVSRSSEALWMSNNVNSDALCRHLKDNGSDYDRIVMGPYLFGLIYNAAMIHPEKTILVPCLHDEPFAYLESFKDMFRNVRGFMFNAVPEQELANRLFFDNAKGAKPEMSVVGMGFDEVKYDKEAFLKKHKLTDPYIIYSGRREPMKGTPLLIDYMNAFRSRTKRDVKLVFTGSGPIEAPPEMAKHIIDLGFVSEEDKYAAMSGAIAFCHPSTNESFGIVLMEAFLAGTAALVHSNSEVLRYQCKESNGGLWFRAYPEFEEQLLLLLDDEEIRNSMAQSGQDYARQEYSWDAIDKRLFASLDG